MLIGKVKKNLRKGRKDIGGCFNMISLADWLIGLSRGYSVQHIDDGRWIL